MTRETINFKTWVKCTRTIVMLTIAISFLSFIVPTVVSAQISNFQTVLTPGAASWEVDGVGTPFVLKENGTYKMWYSGNAYFIPTDFNSKIGYAESTDGIN